VKQLKLKTMRDLYFRWCWNYFTSFNWLKSKIFLSELIQVRHFSINQIKKFLRHSKIRNV